MGRSLQTGDKTAVIPAIASRSLHALVSPPQRAQGQYRAESYQAASTAGSAGSQGSPPKGDHNRFTGPSGNSDKLQTKLQQRFVRVSASNWDQKPLRHREIRGDSYYNPIEKRYRDDLNKKFLELIDVLDTPVIERSGCGSHEADFSPLSKGVVLALAKEKIIALQNGIKELQCGHEKAANHGRTQQADSITE